MLLKHYGAEEYSYYVILLSTANLLLLLTNPPINPYFVREASIEYSNLKIIKNSFSILIFSLSIILLIIIFLFDDLNNYLNFIDISYKRSLFFFIFSLLLINILKIVSRVTNQIIIYFWSTLVEKLTLLVLIFYFILFSRNSNISNLIEIYTLIILLISLSLIISIKSYFKIIFKINTSFYKKFFGSISYIYLSTFLFFFINQYYLIIIMKNLFKDNILVSSLGFSFLIINMLYFPIYWFEQNYSHQYYNKIKKFDSTIFNNYFKKFGYFLSIFISLLVSFTLLSIDIFPILEIFSNEFAQYKMIMFSIVLILFSFVLDTILSIPIYAIKKEKYIFFSLLIRFVIFYIFLNTSIFSPISLVFLYVILAYLQNFITLLFLYFVYNYSVRYIYVLICVFVSLNVLILMEQYLIFKIILILQLLISSLIIFREKINIYNFLKEQI